ncbi:MAG: FxsA family protein [Paracoccaceae bacterium]|nr:FxsA [Paracoccaceae bacterium]RZO34549.1 MAG: FxsA family protein [Paracoccaceae bacterium]|tara:strand:- start:2928 stop:3374 length:447 start_codon:yes stop_codon:yes gene_type:complete
MWLFLLFIVIPIVEIVLFIKIGSLLGLWLTILVVVLTAIVGTNLVKSQGLNAIKQVQSSFLQGQDIARSLINGTLILIAGVLLLTPGFFTDFIGITFLIPVTRNMWISYGIKHFPGFVFINSNNNSKNNPHFKEKNDVIDGDYTDLDK